MATFGAPIINEDNPEQALQAGYKICQKMDELIHTREIPYINFGIGLHYGPVVVGNIGNEVRKQFSVTGKTVIIAARLEQLNKELGTRFLVSERIYKKINQKEYSMVAAGTFHLKGIEEDMLVYEVQSLVPNQLK
jgi:class 3 adenylate cyclase